MARAQSMRPGGASPWVIALIAFAATLGGCSPHTEDGEISPVPGSPHYRNLVVVMIDTLRADHLPSYGYPRETAPFLRHLSAEGIQLEGFSASSWTRPSIATLLTGTAPQRHQTIGRTDSLPPDLPYLPELLSLGGYDTAAYVANLNASRKWGFGRGFADYHQTRPGSGKEDATRVTEVAARLVERLEPPYFLWLHYVDPHAPYQPRRVWSEDTTDGDEDEDEDEDDKRYQPGRLTPAELRSPAVLQRMRDQYDGEILEVDRAIEKVFELLDERSLLDSTLVVVTSDHGEEFGEHGDVTHGRSLFEEVIRVPLIFWAREGLPRGARPGRFHQVDFLPTVLEALDQGAAVEPARLSGRSRWQEIQAGVTDSAAHHFHLDLDGRGMLGLRVGDEPASTSGAPKLVLEIDPSSGTLHGLQFDLATDPGELEASVPDPALVRHALLVHDREGALASGRVIEDLDSIGDAGLRADLEALGYLDDETDDRELRARALPEFLDPDTVAVAGPPPH